MKSEIISDIFKEYNIPNIIDYLSIDNYWIKKSKKNPKDYKQHIKDLPAPIAPTGLPLGAPDVSRLMHQLDGALFMKQYQGQPWSMEELKRLSAFGARFKETAVLTNNFPLGKNFTSALSEDVLVFLNPLGKSIIKSVSDKFPASSLVPCQTVCASTGPENHFYNCFIRIYGSGIHFNSCFW